jgi:hypothetical protein
MFAKLNFLAGPARILGSLQIRVQAGQGSCNRYFHRRFSVVQLIRRDHCASYCVKITFISLHDMSYRHERLHCAWPGDQYPQTLTVYESATDIDSMVREFCNVFVNEGCAYLSPGNFQQLFRPFAFRQSTKHSPKGAWRGFGHCSI